MDTRHDDTKHTRELEDFRLSWLIRLPFQLCLDLMQATWGSFRLRIPQFIPLLVFVTSIPVLLFFSFSAGWFVWRSIAVGWETDVYLQYGDGVPPYAETSLPVLAVQQPYDVSLHLVIPITSANLELGNFMTTLTITNFNNQSIASVRRPSLVIAPGFMPWSSVLGRRNTITLDIPLLSHVVLGTNHAIARVELGRRDQWKSIGAGQGRELSISSALLRGVVVHKGLRGLLTRFPLLTALLASGVFFFLSFVVLASCLLPAIEWRVQGSTESIDPSAYERSIRRVKREPSAPAIARPSRAKRSRSLTTPSRQRPPSIVKEEDNSVPSTSSSTMSAPLRRRRSQQLYSDND